MSAARWPRNGYAAMTAASARQTTDSARPPVVMSRCPTLLPRGPGRPFSPVRRFGVG